MSFKNTLNERNDYNTDDIGPILQTVMLLVRESRP